MIQQLLLEMHQAMLLVLPLLLLLQVLPEPSFELVWQVAGSLVQDALQDSTMQMVVQEAFP